MDTFLGRFKNLIFLEAILFAQDNDRFCAKFPAPTVQRPCYSDVEDKQVDYINNP